MRIVNKIYYNFFSNTNSQNMPYTKLEDNNDNPKGVIINALSEWKSENNSVDGKLPHWDLDKIPLKYYVDNTFKNQYFLPQFIASIDNCFMAWTRASYGMIRFQKVFNKSNADILLQWSDSTTLGRDNEVGHNNLKVVNNKILNAEITIIVYPEIDKTLNNSSRIERVRRTALHEIGHSLGLNHSQSGKDIMYYRSINNKSISSNDIKRLNDLYSQNRPKVII